MQVASTLPDLRIDFADEALMNRLMGQSNEQIIASLNAAMNAQVDTTRHIEILVEHAIRSGDEDEIAAFLAGIERLIKNDTMMRIGSAVRVLLNREGRHD